VTQPTCFACAPLRAKSVPLHEQGRIQPDGVAAAAHAIRIRLNRERPASPPLSNIGKHTRDCRRDKAHRDSYARAHEGARP
jgi:hypothetical protein